MKTIDEKIGKLEIINDVLRVIDTYCKPDYYYTTMYADDPAFKKEIEAEKMRDDCYQWLIQELEKLADKV